MVELNDILKEALRLEASDVFIIPGLPLTYKVLGKQDRSNEILHPDDTETIVRAIYTQCGRHNRVLEDETFDDDFSFSIAALGRFRANVFHQRSSLAVVLRVIRFGLPDASRLGIPASVMRAADIRNGLILVTGATGSGKSTTLACMIDHINRSREGHIITMEDPIEFVHRHDRCIVTQREIGNDVVDYIHALRSALRESPDVILLGEMRDHETIEVAMTAAETGILLFSTLHTQGAANAVDRIIDIYPAGQQNQIRLQLAMMLRCVISQQLIPTIDGQVTAVFEVMYANTAIRSLIREGKTHQIDATIRSGASEGMIAMDESIYDLFKKGRITQETAVKYCNNPEAMERRLNATVGF
ncbi:MAG TPA: type IV pili twitching motility protein PilT [Lachnospiraceae bacterium]|nr:type IV pili twitching motility protein PilT [Lachnospiraceae bacterium]